MIKLNGIVVKQEKFGDGSLKCDTAPISALISDRVYCITWCYDDDSEIFTLWALVNQIRDVKGKNSSICLEMPYIPHARQDRNVSNRLFTLKYFAKLLNEMNFEYVKVLDPHSDVSVALIDNIKVTTVEDLLGDSFEIPVDTVIMYPDNGAAKKHGATDKNIIGNKHRNSDGIITDYELINFKEGTKDVLIIDDICSYAGTHVAAAKILKEHGVEQVDLLVSHCEHNVFRGEAFNYIDHIYTTDSILDLKQLDSQENEVYLKNKNKLIIIKEFRKYD